MQFNYNITNTKYPDDMHVKKLYNYFFLKNDKILAPIIARTERKARKLLQSQHSYVNASGKEQLIHVSIFQTYYSMAL